MKAYLSHLCISEYFGTEDENKSRGLVLAGRSEIWHLHHGNGQVKPSPSPKPLDTGFSNSTVTILPSNLIAQSLQRGQMDTIVQGSTTLYLPYMDAQAACTVSAVRSLPWVCLAHSPSGFPRQPGGSCLWTHDKFIQPCRTRLHRDHLGSSCCPSSAQQYPSQMTHLLSALNFKPLRYTTTQHYSLLYYTKNLQKKKKISK